MERKGDEAMIHLASRQIVLAVGLALLLAVGMITFGMVP